MAQPGLKYCPECGTKLIMKALEGEGIVPYCEHCGDYRFPFFNTAVSMIVMNRTKDKILLIKQYGRDHYILVAGYINKGENAETAVCREVMEELGLKVEYLRFNRTEYYAPSNTLMENFTVIVDSEAAEPNREIDSWAWFSIEEARKNIFAGSLAQRFLYGYLDEPETT